MTARNDLLTTGEFLGNGNTFKLEAPPPTAVVPAIIGAGAVVKNYELAPLAAEDLFSLSNLNSTMPSAHDKLPGAQGLAEVIDRCLKKRREERFASAAELADALEKLSEHHRVKAVSEDECPFAGLSAFQEVDADRFFGRDDDIAAVVGRLRQQQLVTIAGASGAGKSSFVRAGVIPALKRTNAELEVFVVRPGSEIERVNEFVKLVGGDVEDDLNALLNAPEDHG